MPDPILVGRNAAKLEKLAAKQRASALDHESRRGAGRSAQCGLFRRQTTDRRVEAVTKAIAAGKHIYCEKPTATTAAEALELYRLAKAAGREERRRAGQALAAGPAELKLLIDSGFFGQILSVRGEFGYWVFEGDTIPAQRPSWNYRKEDGGGIIVDMLCHLRYVLDNLFGEVKAVSCLGRDARRRALGRKRQAPTTAPPTTPRTRRSNWRAASSRTSTPSWCFRVRRDDLLVLQVDGTKGIAVAGLRDVGRSPTPTRRGRYGIPTSTARSTSTTAGSSLPPEQTYDNAFKVEWELFLRHVVKDEPFRWTLLEGAKGVQLAEKGEESWKQRKWIVVPKMDGTS